MAGNGSRAGGGRKAGGAVAEAKAIAPGQNAKIPTNLPGIESDRWKWNGNGTLATDADRRHQFGRERQREKNILLQKQQELGWMRASRRALQRTLDGYDSEKFSFNNRNAREALLRKAKRASNVFGGQRPPKRMSKRAAEKFAKRRANSERVGRRAMEIYAGQKRYVESRTIEKPVYWR